MARALLPPSDELAELRARSVEPFVDALRATARAVLQGDTEAVSRSRDDTAELLTATMSLANLMGRRRLLLEIDHREGGRVELRQGGRIRLAQAESVYLADGPPSPVIPRIPFKEAIQNIIERDPRLVEYGNADQVAEDYSREHVFEMAFSATLQVTQRAQELLADAMQQGLYRHEVTQAIADSLEEDLKDWSRSYAECVYQTNLAAAYTAGKFAIALDPHVSDYAMAFRFDAVLDSDTRKNHRAADGLVAAVSDPIWHQEPSLAPPLGYSCRCTLSYVTRDELAALGLLDSDGNVRPARWPSGAAPDARFGGHRPDITRHFAA